MNEKKQAAEAKKLAMALSIQAMRLIAVARKHRDTLGDIIDMQETTMSAAAYLTTIKED